MVKSFPAVFCSVVLASATVAADDTLEQCRELQAEMDRYEELRRDGGSAEDMDAWKRARRESQAEFRDLGCHYRHHEL